MLDTYTGRENETLEVLKIYPMKTLAFEEKADSDTFEEYDPDNMIIKVNVWREGLTSLSEDALKPVHMKVGKDLPMDAFRTQIAQANGIDDPANVIVMKRNPMLNSMKQLEVVSDQLEKTLN